MWSETLELEVRGAGEHDALMLWAWANDRAVREASFHGEWIPWDAHREWFSARLGDATSWLYVVEVAGRPAAQVRFDLRTPGEAEISVTVAPGARGHGVGTAAVRRACLQLADETDVRSIVARVKTGNTPSLRLFEKAGFLDEGGETVAGWTARRLRLELAE